MLMTASISVSCSWKNRKSSLSNRIHTPRQIKTTPKMTYMLPATLLMKCLMVLEDRIWNIEFSKRKIIRVLQDAVGRFLGLLWVQLQGLIFLSDQRQNLNARRGQSCELPRPHPKVPDQTRASGAAPFPRSGARS